VRAEQAPRLLAGRRWRLLAVYRLLFRVLLGYGWLQLRGLVAGPEWTEQALLRAHRLNAGRIRETILKVQGLFIKVGQLLSILSNFLPAEFRGELEAVQDQIPPRPLAEILERLRSELGGEPEKLFAAFDPVPLASASLAQVHAAHLHDGRHVAVKVQHVDIEVLAKLDLRTIRHVLKILQVVLGVRGLAAVFDEVSAMITEELDFTQEAANVVEIGGGFVDDPEVSCPEVVTELSSGRVLTTTFIKGMKVTDEEELVRHGIDREALAERILGAYCRMIFRDGLYHADPHPGNILVEDDGSIVFIDFGAVARLSPSMKAGIPQLLEAVLKRDQEEILRALQGMGFVRRRDDDSEMAERILDYFYSRFLEGIELDSWNLQDIHVDARMKLEVMADLSRLDISMSELTSTFQVPREWILLQRTILLLTGVCTELSPEMRPLAIVRPYLEELVLGKDRDWVALAGSAVKDMALTALTLPGEIRRLLHQANRGKARIEVRGVGAGARLLYASGHQLLYGFLASASVGLAYHARLVGDDKAWTVFASSGCFWMLCLGGSLWRARKLEKELRQRSRRS
jgi:ubiquinone biosynthesis protein